MDCSKYRIVIASTQKEIITHLILYFKYSKKKKSLDRNFVETNYASAVAPIFYGANGPCQPPNIGFPGP